jgi:hypothetical protein
VAYFGSLSRQSFSELDGSHEPGSFRQHILSASSFEIEAP